MAEAAAEPEPTWALAVEPAPLHAKLLLSIAPAAGMLTRQEEPVLKLFMNLAQRGLQGSIVTALKNYTPLYMGCIHKDSLYKLKPCTCRDRRIMYRKHSM